MAPLVSFNFFWARSSELSYWRWQSTPLLSSLISLRAYNSLVVGDDNPPSFSPLSSLLELKALSYLVANYGDPTPLSPLSTPLKLRALSFLIVGNGNPPPLSPLSTLSDLRTLLLVFFFLLAISATMIDASSLF